MLLAMKEMGRLEKDRKNIQRLAEVAGLSVSGLARKAKLATSTLTRIMNPNVPPDYEISKRSLDAAARAAGFESFDSFILNEAISNPPLAREKPKSASGLSDSYKTPEYRSQPLDSDFVRIEMYGGTVSGGDGCYNDSETIVDGLSFKKSWLRSITSAPFDKLKIVHLTGDSMEPAIFDGDLVLVDTSQVIPKSNGVYVMWYDGGAIAKRISIDVPRRKVTLTSDNPKYPDKKVYDADDLHVTGKVLWRAGRV